MIDQTVTQWINGAAGVVPALDLFATGVSAFGIYVMVGFVALQWFANVVRQHVRHVAVTAGLAFVLALGINQLILLGVLRVRPYDGGITHLIVAKSADWSFPSDHAAAAAAIAATFVTKGLSRRGLILTAAALLVGWSRVFVGIHFVGDVLGGFAVGVAATGLVAWRWREGNWVERQVTRVF